jgi:glycosyltransferase involved in cell wall biosynthesis
VRVPVSVVPTGIDLRRFAAGDGTAFRAANGIPADAPLLGHVGRIEREKNVEHLARAAAIALQRDPACWLLLAGEGSRRQAVAQLLDEAGVRGRCVLAGWLRGAQLADAYAAMDMFLFASRSETQGMVLAEAMAAGTPVIAVDAPGARDIVRDGRTGFLLPADATAEAYAAAILRWRGLPQEELQRWRAGIAATVQAYSLDHCMGRLEQLYAELLEGRDFTGNITPWEQLMGRFEAEWELAVEKARAASAALARLNGE